MTWGAQANGLAPQRRHQLRAMAAKGLWLQRSGSVDIVFDMNQKHPDPDSIVLQHIHTVWKIYHSFDDSKQHLFKSWAPFSQPNTDGKSSRDHFRHCKPTCLTMDLTSMTAQGGTDLAMLPSRIAPSPSNSFGLNWITSSGRNSSDSSGNDS